jgi:hypothetical protein
LYPCQYLIVDGFDFDFTAASGSITIGYGAHHICIRNFSIVGYAPQDPEDPNYTSADSAYHASGILLQTSDIEGRETEHIVLHNFDISYTGNWQYAGGDNDPDAHSVSVGFPVNDVWIVDGTMSYTSGCAVQLGAGSIDTTPDANSDLRCYVGRCTAHHIAQSAIWSKRSVDCVFSQNHVYALRRDTPSSPNSSGLGGQYGPVNLWFLCNTVHDCQGGIKIESGVTPAEGVTNSDLYFVGNVFYDIHDEEGSVSNWRSDANSAGGTCITLRGNANHYLVNNTFHDYDAGVCCPIIGSNRFVEGNIFSGRNGAVSGLDIHLEYDASSANTIKNNIIEEVSGACWVRSSSTYTTVASLNAVGGNKSANSAVAPTYVDSGSGDLNLTGASNGVDDFGSAAHAVYDLFDTMYGRSIKYDHDGGVRPANTNWDIGAFEYGSEPETPSAPSNVIAPTISGTTNRDETLTAALGTWTGYPTRSYSYQWVRCDADGLNPSDIASATSSTYVIVQADVGGTIKVRVTATNTEGSASATSAATAVIDPQIVTPPTFSAEKNRSPPKGSRAPCTSPLRTVSITRPR